MDKLFDCYAILLNAAVHELAPFEMWTRNIPEFLRSVSNGRLWYFRFFFPRSIRISTFNCSNRRRAWQTFYASKRSAAHHQLRSDATTHGHRALGCTHKSVLWAALPLCGRSFHACPNVRAVLRKWNIKKPSQRKSEREEKRKKQMFEVEICKFSIIRNRFSFTFIFFSHVLSFFFLDDYHFASSSPALRYNLPSSSVGFSSLSLTHLCARYARVRFQSGAHTVKRWTWTSNMAVN